MQKNYYDILEISPQATNEQIKQAAVELGKKYAAKSQTHYRVRARFNEIRQAYQVLSNPQLRKYYDANLEEQTENNAPGLIANLSTKLAQQFAPGFNPDNSGGKPKLAILKSQAKILLWRTRKTIKKALSQPQLISPKERGNRQKCQLLENERLIQYTKPHILSCIEFGALLLIFISLYLLLTKPYELHINTPIVTLWLPEQISEYLPQISVWQLGLGSMLFMGLLMQLEAIITAFNTELLITSKRIIGKSGVFKRKLIEIKISTIESVTTQQSLLGRIFDYGDITILGLGQSKIELYNLKNLPTAKHLLWQYNDKRKF